MMEEKLRFVFDCELGERSMTELCQRCAIAPETGYAWLRRYRQPGVTGLIEHSRAAHHLALSSAVLVRTRHFPYPRIVPFLARWRYGATVST